MTPCPKCQRRAPEVRTKRTHEPRFRLEGVACDACGYVQIAPAREWRGMWDQDFATGGIE
jgi:hypothetical protein